MRLVVLVLAVLVPVAMVIAAVVLGVRMRRTYGDVPEQAELKAAVAGLSGRDRLRVLRAVNAGRAVVDPRLAAAAVARARFGRRYNERYRAGRAIKVFLGIAVLLLAGGIVRLATADEAVDWVPGVGLTAGGLANLVLPLTLRRGERRLAAAERANAALLGG